LKEIAIRKVLGLRSETVIGLLLVDKISLVFLSSVIGSVVTWFVMHSWLQNFSFIVHLTFLDLSLPSLIIIAIMAVSIGYHLFNAVGIELANILKKD
jgi:putative ABC transport system permease protein